MLRPTITKATLKKREILAPQIQRLELLLKDPISFLPGQYISLRGFGIKRYRAFSFSSSPNPNKIEIIIKEHKEFTKLLMAAPLNSELEAMAPMGRFLHDIKDAVFVAAGVGITPFLSFLRWMRDNNIIDREVWLFYSCKTRQNILVEEELRDMQEELSNINIILTLTQEKPQQWDMELGRINHELLIKYLGSLDRDFYTCGPEEMIKTLHERLIKAGVPKNRLFEEDWG